MQFRWNAEHVEKHGISAYEAEFIVESTCRPYPEMVGEGKRYVLDRRLRDDMRK